MAEKGIFWHLAARISGLKDDEHSDLPLCVRKREDTQKEGENLRRRDQTGPGKSIVAPCVFVCSYSPPRAFSDRPAFFLG